MPKIPGISQRDAIRVFEKLGYRVARQSVSVSAGTTGGAGHRCQIVDDYDIYDWDE